MRKLTIQTAGHPRPEDIYFLENSSEASSDVHVDMKPLAVFLRDPSEKIRGGLTGGTSEHWFRIHNIWLEKPLRGKGYGKRILHAAEKEARSRGCKIADVATYSFQAPEFYLKSGYEIFGKLEDIGKGKKLLFLKKRL